MLIPYIRYILNIFILYMEKHPTLTRDERMEQYIEFGPLGMKKLQFPFLTYVSPVSSMCILFTKANCC